MNSIHYRALRLVDEQFAGINSKDVPLSQMFDFILLQQILNEGR